MIESDNFAHGMERVNLTTTSKGPLGKYAGVFVGLAFCQIPRKRAAAALWEARKEERKARKEAA